MTHADLYKLYMGILGRGMYTPTVLLSRLEDYLKRAGHPIRIRSSDDLKLLPEAALSAAAAYLSDPRYEGRIDVDRAAALAARS